MHGETFHPLITTMGCTLVHFGAVVADAPSPLSTPRSAAGQAQLRLGKPLRKKCRASPDAFRHAGRVVAGSVGIVRATVPFHGEHDAQSRRRRVEASFYMPVTCIIGKVSVVLDKKIPRISSAQENHRRVSRISCNGCAPVLASTLVLGHAADQY